MSNFWRMTRNPRTGVMEPASWIDNYFDDHEHGIKFFGESDVYSVHELDGPNDVGEYCAPPIQQETQRWPIFHRIRSFVRSVVTSCSSFLSK